MILATALEIVGGLSNPSKMPCHSWSTPAKYCKTGKKLALVSGSTMMSLFTIMGFCVGMVGPSRDLMIRAATPKEASGRVFGIVYSGLDSALAVGPLLFGLLMDWEMAPGVFICIAIFLLLSLLTAYRVSGNTRTNQLIKNE